jgi:uncharacterized protein (DUF2147 family)
MNKALSLLLAASALCSPLCAQIDSIVGRWNTVDDKTGERQAAVLIYRADDGRYYGKIEKMYRHADAVCDRCEGADKGRPILGMLIIREMKADRGQLQDGYVVDPKNGKRYYATIRFDPLTGRLQIRGSLDKRGWLGRNQYWTR